MLRRVSPIEYNLATKKGKTLPSFITCETNDGSNSTVEVVAKFSAGCEQGNINLACEVIAACLAADLGLPIPEPFLIEVTPEWPPTIPDQSRRALVQKSSPIAFGSKNQAGQFNDWNIGNKITDSMLPIASSIFVFDGIIQNPDRIEGNPNCLIRGESLVIFDHELAFSHRLVFGWKPPWVLGGLQHMAQSNHHIFHRELRVRKIDYEPIRAAWKGLSDTMISDYERAIPVEWKDASSVAAEAAHLIKDARDNIDDVLQEVMRVLS